MNNIPEKNQKKTNKQKNKIKLHLLLKTAGKIKTTQKQETVFLNFNKIL